MQFCAMRGGREGVSSPLSTFDKWTRSWCFAPVSRSRLTSDTGALFCIYQKRRHISVGLDCAWAWQKCAHRGPKHLPMGDRPHHLPAALARTLPLADIGPHRHDPIKPSIRIIHQHVPYCPRITRKRVFPRLHQGEISFLDCAFTELGAELASLESVSCEEERAGCILVWL